uniref:Uncharacterized protein n=1 Tax=Cryptococcus bacillisporus CA1280 TaxID=1296109 RepID=A0A0D0TFG4_CRYGA|nr:hypothetical protein I312_05689 [Cryptococcus bacillisporus CA1280]
MSQTRASHHMTSGVLHPCLDRAMKPVCPKFLYPLFIGTQMIVFWGITLVERFAQGEFDYHDEDLHTPIIWHFFVSLPFYLLRATPTLSTLRLISLAQALILPTVITLVTNSTPSPRPLVFQRVVDAIREPSDFGLVCGLNPLAILMAVSFTPGLSCLLCLLILWRLSVKGNHWIGAAVAAGIGLLRAGVMFWVIFVIGWTAHEISVSAPQKLAITNYYPYLFTLAVWMGFWSQQSIRFQWSGFYDIVSLLFLRFPITPVWDIYSPIMLFKRFRWTGLWALTTLFTYTVSGTTTNNQVILVDQCLPIFILRLYLLFLQGKENADWQERRMEVLEEGRGEVRLEGTGVNGQLPDVTLYAYGQHANQTEADASNLPEQREEEHEPLVGLDIGEEQRTAVAEENVSERERTEDTEVEGQEPQQRVQKMHIGRIELGRYLLSIALGALIILLVGNNN